MATSALARSDAGNRWRAPGLWRALAVCLAARVAYPLVIAIAIRTRDRPGGFLGLMDAWDSAWYFRIARSGYPSGALDTGQEEFLRFAFFPLWPGVLRLSRGWSSTWQVTYGLAVVTLCSLVFTALVWRLVADRFGERDATWAASLLAVAPGCYVFSFLYSEPLFLAFAAAFFWQLGRERWVAAGVLAALAGLTRPNAIAIAAAAMWVVVRHRPPLRALVAPALAVAGLAAHQILTWRRTGELTGYLTIQRDGWGTGFDAGRVLVVDRLIPAVSSPTDDINAVVAALGFVVAVIGLVLLVRQRAPGEWIVYSAVVLALAYFNRNVTSSARFTYTAFPVLVAVAIAIRPRWRPVAFAVAALTSGVIVWTIATGIAITP